MMYEVLGLGRAAAAGRGLKHAFIHIFSSFSLEYLSTKACALVSGGSGLCRFCGGQGRGIVTFLGQDTTFTLPLSTQEYEWLTANLYGQPPAID